MWTKMLKHKKWLIVGLVVLIAGTAGYTLLYGNKAKAAVTLQTIKVERGDIVSGVSSTGTIKPVNSVDISAKITAQIKEVKVKENESVKKGQVLVVLDDDELQTEVTQAKERLNNAAANYERNQRLNAIGAVSDQQLDDSLMQYHTAQASYDGVMSKLEETVITSPIDGVVIGKPLPAGQMVAQGISNPMVILTVADMSKLQIETLVDETDISKIVFGQQASFTVDGQPNKTFAGVVAGISQKATVQQNVVYYTVTVDVNDAQNALKPSMTARVTVNASESKNALNIPLSAVRSNSNGQYVVVSRGNGQTENVAITTGITGEDRVEVISGLNEGDKIVITGNKAQGKTNGQGGGSTGNPMGGMMRRM